MGYIRELPVPGLSLYPGASANASEDFALIAERVPSAFFYLGSGYLDERGNYGAHNPKVVFDEAVCRTGSLRSAVAEEALTEKVLTDQPDTSSNSRYPVVSNRFSPPTIPARSVPYLGSICFIQMPYLTVILQSI